jgi:hypothetical protein
MDVSSLSWVITKVAFSVRRGYRCRVDSVGRGSAKKKKDWKAPMVYHVGRYLPLERWGAGGAPLSDPEMGAKDGSQ